MFLHFFSLYYSKIIHIKQSEEKCLYSYNLMICSTCDGESQVDTYFLKSHTGKVRLKILSDRYKWLLHNSYQSIISCSLSKNPPSSSFSTPRSFCFSVCDYKLNRVGFGWLIRQIKPLGFGKLISQFSDILLTKWMRDSKQQINW